MDHKVGHTDNEGNWLCTSDHLPSSRVGLQGTEQDFGLVGRVYTCLHHLLEHGVHWPWAKVVWQMLHLLPVQVGTTVPMLVHIHTHWEKDTNRRHTLNKFDTLVMCFHSIKTIK